MLAENTKDKIVRFKEIFNHCYPKVKRFTSQLLKSDEDAEDITQEIFIKLWEKPILWENAELLDGYLYTIARNSVYNFLRHETVKQKYVDDTLHSSTLADYGVDSAEDHLQTRELELIIQMTIDKMPEKRKLIFKMSREEQLSNQEIATRLDLSVRTVEQHIYKALVDLKSSILLFVFIIISSSLFYFDKFLSLINK